ncbi:MAG: OsmC family protein [Actinomycetota bacterium]
MSVTRLIWHEHFRFTGYDSRGRGVMIDAHPDGSGAKPSDLLPISLAACTAYDIVNILHKQRQDLRALEATIESVQDADPPWRFQSIMVRYTAYGEVDPVKAQKALALSEEKYCSISATLRPVVDMTFEIEVVAGEPPPG